MNPRPAPAAEPRRLRVAVLAGDPDTLSRLTAMVAASGHETVAPGEPADAGLTDDPVMTASPGLPVVVLGDTEAEVAGILPVATNAAQLDAALRAVASGLVVRPPSAAPAGFGSLPDDPGPALTPREIEVLTALAGGLGNKAVARRLGISPHTVKFHIEQLFRKLDAATRAEAVAKGLRRQIVEF
jgi:DNA-binding CsgD family transcriptional regulator